MNFCKNNNIKDKAYAKLLNVWSGQNQHFQPHECTHAQLIPVPFSFCHVRVKINKTIPLQDHYTKVPHASGRDVSFFDSILLTIHWLLLLTHCHLYHPKSLPQE